MNDLLKLTNRGIVEDGFPVGVLVTWYDCDVFYQQLLSLKHVVSVMLVVFLHERQLLPWTLHLSLQPLYLFLHRLYFLLVLYFHQLHLLLVQLLDLSYYKVEVTWPAWKTDEICLWAGISTPPTRLWSVGNFHRTLKSFTGSVFSRRLRIYWNVVILNWCRSCFPFFWNIIYMFILI